MSEYPSIAEFYNGQTIFITGVTGFLGKVLIEKLLRKCPGIRKIYVLIRPKKGKDTVERLRMLWDCPLFDLLRSQKSDGFEKVVPILGDISLLGLGLADEHRQVLIDEVTLVFHGAATVRFDEPLRTAVLINVRGTREVIDLAKKMVNLAVFTYVSTAYANATAYTEIIEERIYPAHIDWRDVIRIAENVHEPTLNVLTAKFIEPFPTSYTFSKFLAEHVVEDLCDGIIPCLIARPTVVYTIWLDPIEGWCNSFIGPFGIQFATIKGLARSIYSDPQCVVDHIPADVTARSMIIMCWKKGNSRLLKGNDRLEVFHLSNLNETPITIQQSFDIFRSNPENVGAVLWYPDRNPFNNNWYSHCYKVIMYHFLGALLLDGLLKLFGKPPMMLKIQRKLAINNISALAFLTHTWKFLNDKIFEAETLLLPEDIDARAFYRREVKTDEQLRSYLGNSINAGRKYLMKDYTKSNIKLMWTVSVIFSILWYGVLFWLIFFKLDGFGWVTEKIENYKTYITEL